MRPEVQYPLTRSFGGGSGLLQLAPAELNLGQLLILNQETKALSTWAHAPRDQWPQSLYVRCRVLVLPISHSKSSWQRRKAAERTLPAGWQKMAPSSFRSLGDRMPVWVLDIPQENILNPHHEKHHSWLSWGFYKEWEKTCVSQISQIVQEK